VRGADSTTQNNRGGVQEKVSTNTERPAWETPVLTYEGNVDELVLAIPGKTSVTPGDAQENRKVPGL
jgi:hypothetical protein